MTHGQAPPAAPAPPGPHAALGRGVRLGCLAGALFVALGVFAIQGRVIGVFVDDAIYLASGRELVSAGAYRIPFLPGEPLSGKYPPLFPLVLGLLSAPLPASADSLWTLKLACLLLSLPGFVCLGGFLELSAGHLSRPARRSVLFATACGAALLSVCIEIMSEGLFFSLAMATLLSLAWLGDAPNQDAPSQDMHARGASTARPLGRLHPWLVPAALALLAWYTRGVGIALCLAVVFAAGQRRPTRGLWVLSALLLLHAPWSYFRGRYVPAHEPMLAVLPYLLSYSYHTEGLIAFLGEGPGHALAYLATSMETSVAGLGAALLPMPNHPAAGASPLSASASGWTAAAVVAVGAVQALRRRAPYAIFAVLYAGLIGLWPWFNKARFFALLLPLWLLLGAEGLAHLSQQLRRWFGRPGRAVAPVATLATLVVLVSQLGHYVDTVFMAGDVAADIASDGQSRPPSAVERASAWLREHTEPDALLVTNLSGPLFAMHTGRQVLPYAMALHSARDAITAQVLPDGKAPPAPDDLSTLLRRAQPLLDDRPLWHVYLCQRDCGQLIDAEPMPDGPVPGHPMPGERAVFRDAGPDGAGPAGGGAIAIRRLALTAR